MKKALIAFLSLYTLTVSLALAQQDTLAYKDPIPEYTRLVEKAYALYEAKDYKQSALTYAAAVKANGGIGYRDDRYNAACSWALAGQTDSAFFNLNRVAIVGKFADLRHITTDKDLTSLHADKRWQPLLTVVQQNKDKEEEKYNKPLVRQLDTIYTGDQGIRVKMDTVQKQYGFDSKEMRSLISTMIEGDSINLIKVKAILDQHGWLGPDSIGEAGATTLFLVIQHADLATQEKYLPMMKEAVNDGRAEKSQLAYLIDRIEMYNGRPQVYGSQLIMKNGKYVVYRLLDEANVNKRRAEVDLEPLETHLKRLNINYKPAKN